MILAHLIIQDVLREPFELSGIVLALAAVIAGVWKVSAKLVDLKLQLAAVQSDLVQIKDRLEKIEGHLAPTT